MSLGTAVETLATVKMVSSRVQTTRRNTPLMTLVSVNSEWSTKMRSVGTKVVIV